MPALVFIFISSCLYAQSADRAGVEDDDYFIREERIRERLSQEEGKLPSIVDERSEERKKIPDQVVGDVEVDGNRFFKDALIRERIGFKSGDILDLDLLKHNVWRLNKHPDRKVYAFIEDGVEPGITDIVVEVKDRLPVHMEPEWDNYGSEFINNNRYRVTGTHNNVTGCDDVFSVKYQLAEYDAQKVVQTNYTLPLNRFLNIMFTSIYKKEQFVGDARNLDMRKTSRWFTLVMTGVVVDTPKCKFSLNTGFDYKDFYSYRLGRETSRDRLRSARLGFDLDFFDAHSTTIIMHETYYGIPDIMGGLKSVDLHASSRGSGGKFVIHNIVLARRNDLIYDVELLMKTQFQISPYILPAGEKFKLGGFSNARGYPRSEFSGDKGYALTLGLDFPPYFIPENLRIPFSKTTFRKSLRITLFHDWSYAWLRRPGANEKKNNSLRSFGCGLRFSLPEQFSLRIDVAWPLDETPSDGDHMHMWFMISKEF